MEEDLKEKVHEFIDDIEECGLSDCACSMEDKYSQCEMLRNYITNLERENTRLKYQDIPYLEGTIKGYKDRVEELKQELKKFYEGEIFTAKQLKNIEQNQKKHFINKQTVKEKIEELKQEIEQIRNETGVTWDNELYVNQTKIDVLKELLEEE